MNPMQKFWDALLDYAAAAVCVGAGVYLLGHGSPPGIQQTWFEVLAHGIGAYAIGKGAFIARALHYQRRAQVPDARVQTRIVEHPR